MAKREDNLSPEQLRREASEIERSGDTGGKNPGNVAGGKKAAAARKERGKSGRSSSRSSGSDED